MASIQKRQKKYRVRLRPQGLPVLTITFSTLKKAEEWIEEHEQKYIDDPETYQKWIKLNRRSIRDNGIWHIHIPMEQKRML